MTPRFVLKRSASNDIADATAWYALRSTSLAAEFVRAVDVALAEVRRTPERFPRVSSNVRRALLRRFPYSVFFTSHDDTTTIIACLHHRRNPRHWRARR